MSINKFINRGANVLGGICPGITKCASKQHRSDKDSEDKNIQTANTQVLLRRLCAYSKSEHHVRALIRLHEMVHSSSEQQKP